MFIFFLFWKIQIHHFLGSKILASRISLKPGSLALFLVTKKRHLLIYYFIYIFVTSVSVLGLLLDYSGITPGGSQGFICGESGHQIWVSLQGM